MDLFLQPLGAFTWVAIVLIGVVVLGLAIAYGAMRTRTSTRQERDLTESGTREVYKEQGRKPL